MSLLVILFSISGFLLAGIAVPLIYGKIPPNGLYGFRVKKTMEHPEIWYPVNTYAGKWLLAAGLGISLASILFSLIPGLSIDIYAYCVLGVWLVLFGLAVFASVRFMNSL